MAALRHLDPFIILIVTVANLTEMGLPLLVLLNFVFKLECVLDVVWVAGKCLDCLGHVPAVSQERGVCHVFSDANLIDDLLDCFVNVGLNELAFKTVVVSHCLFQGQLVHVVI